MSGRFDSGEQELKWQSDSQKIIQLLNNSAYWQDVKLQLVTEKTYA